MRAPALPPARRPFVVTMNALLTFRVALRALRKNKMRAALTILGVVIGIAAVTTMVSIGESAKQLIQDQLATLGTNMIVIFPEQDESRGVRSGREVTLTSDDSDAISDECPAVLASSPIVGTMGQVIYGNTNWNPNEITGVGSDYLLVRNWTIRRGGFFGEREIASAEKVCVIGHTVVAKLFQTRNPVGETVRVNNIPLRIVGVLDVKGANMMGQDQDNVVLIPYTTVRKRLHGSPYNDVHVIMASARTVEGSVTAKQEIENLLADRHGIAPGDPADFQVQTMDEISQMLGMIMSSLTAMLSAIAGISLLVGGVGIMNIMLVSVTERTREIGIRMAVGATSWDILRQFLLEAIVLSCIGGVVGFSLGFGASTGVTTLINELNPDMNLPIVVSIPAAVAAIFFSAAVGVFFGFFPAFRASKLDPIDALRYE